MLWANANADARGWQTNLEGEVRDEFELTVTFTASGNCLIKSELLQFIAVDGCKVLLVIEFYGLENR